MSANLFVGRLSKSVKQRDVQDIFSAYGRLVRCDVKYGTGMAYAFVDYQYKRDAQDAMRYENDREIEGQRIVVEWARGPKRGFQGDDECYNCHQPGHFARECEEARRFGGGRSRYGSGGRSGGWRGDRSRRRYSRSRSRSMSRSRSHSRDRQRRRSYSRERSRSRERSNSKDMKRSPRDHRRSRSKSRSPAQENRSRSRSRSRDKNSRSRSRDRSRSPSKDRENDGDGRGGSPGRSQQEESPGARNDATENSEGQTENGHQESAS